MEKSTGQSAMSATEASRPTISPREGRGADRRARHGGREHRRRCVRRDASRVGGPRRSPPATPRASARAPCAAQRAPTRARSRGTARESRGTCLREKGTHVRIYIAQYARARQRLTEKWGGVWGLRVTKKWCLSPHRK